MQPAGTARPSFLDRLSTFLGGSDKAKETCSPPVLDGKLLERLKALKVEAARLRALISDEEERVESMNERLRAVDAERVDALTQARLAGQSADQERTKALQHEGISLRTGIEDSTAVVGRLRVRLEELQAETGSLRTSYRHAMTKFLDALYERSMERYNALAPEVAEAVLEVAAVRRVMMRYLLGNTNGWSGQVLLPGMRARQGTLVRAILDGDTPEYLAAADQRTADVEAAMCAAGFVYGLE